MTELKLIKLEDKDTLRETCLTKLSNLQGISISQKYKLQETQSSASTPQLYKVYAADESGRLEGKSLLRARSNVGLCYDMCVPNDLVPFDMKIVNHSCRHFNKLLCQKAFQTNTRDVFKMEREYKCPLFFFNRPRTVVTHTEDTRNIILGYIEYPWLMFHHGCYVRNPKNELLFKVTTSCFQPHFLCSIWNEGKIVEFTITNANGQKIGELRKKTPNCSNADDSVYLIMIFPKNISPEEKMLLLCMALQIDMIYFKNTNPEVKQEGGHHKKKPVKSNTQQLAKTMDQLSKTR